MNIWHNNFSTRRKRSGIEDTAGPFDRSVRALRGRILRVAFLRNLMLTLMAYGFLLGTVVLAARYGWRITPKTLAWGIVGFALCLPTAWVAAWIKRPTLHSVRALLDDHDHLGGLLMSSSELDVGAWQESISHPSIPTVRWWDRQLFTMAGIAIVFVLTALVLPARAIRSNTITSLQLDTAAKELEEQIDTLEQEEVLEEQDANDLLEQLERAKKDSDSHSPAKTWESMDHLAQTLRQKAETAVAADRDTLKEEAALKQLMESLADLNKQNPSNTNALSNAAQQELSELLKKLAESMPELSETLKNAGIDPSNLPKLDAADLSKLLKSLDKDMLKRLAKAGKLNSARLIDPSKLSSSKRAGQCSSKELAEMLQKAGNCSNLMAAASGSCSNATASASCNKPGQTGKPGKKGGSCPGKTGGICPGTLPGGTCPDGKAGSGNKSGSGGNGGTSLGQGTGPGRGGVSRGRGDAPLTWKDPSSEQGFTFKEESLPLSPGHAELLGISIAAPDKPETDGASHGGAVTHASGRGATATRHTVLPRHRTAVNTYFDTKE